MATDADVSRRERQLLDAIYQLGTASATDLMDFLDDGSSNSTIRTLLRRLEEKGHIVRKESGAKYLYSPSVKLKTASRRALERVVSTFFDGSALLTVNSLLEIKKGSISKEELDAIEALIKKKKT